MKDQQFIMLSSLYILERFISLTQESVLNKIMGITWMIIKVFLLFILTLKPRKMLLLMTFNISIISSVVVGSFAGQFFYPSYLSAFSKLKLWNRDHIAWRCLIFKSWNYQYFEKLHICQSLPCNISSFTPVDISHTKIKLACC